MILRYLFLIVFISCTNQKKFVESIDKPQFPQTDYKGLIKTNDGKENAKRMKYYNTLQHNKFYKQKL